MDKFFSTFDNNKLMQGIVLESVEDIKTITMDSTNIFKIKVYVPELMPLLTSLGEVATEKAYSPNTNSINNAELKFNAESSNETNYIEMEPLRISNMDPPLFSKGEPIFFIFMNGDFKNPRYLPFSLYDKNRASDRLKFSVMDKLEVNDDHKEYSLTLDSVDQIIKVYMDNGRNEQYSYQLIINGLEGTVTLGDTEGNQFSINSDEKFLEMKNNSGSSVTVSDKDVNIISEANINLQSGSVKIKSDLVKIETDALDAEIKSSQIISNTTKVEGKNLELTETSTTINSKILELSGSSLKINHKLVQFSVSSIKITALQFGITVPELLIKSASLKVYGMVRSLAGFFSPNAPTVKPGF